MVSCDQLILIYSHNKIIFALNPRFTEIGKYPKMIPWVQKVLFNLFWSKRKTKLIHVGFRIDFVKHNLWFFCENCEMVKLTKWRHDLTFGFGAVDSRFSTEINIYLLCLFIKYCLKHYNQFFSVFCCSDQCCRTVRVPIRNHSEYCNPSCCLPVQWIKPRFTYYPFSLSQRNLTLTRLKKSNLLAG